MRVQLAYGRQGLAVELPPGDVIEPAHLAALGDEVGAIRAALRRPGSGRPLSDLVAGGASVGISVCDVTRPFPAARVLPVILDELAPLRAAVTVFIATGTHRACTSGELRQMLGDRVLGECRIVQHDAFQTTRHRSLGLIPGTAVKALIEAEFMASDVRLTTGFIEPHFFAGFSGGPKMVAPGLAAIETVLELHSAARIGDPRAVWGVIDGNPVQEGVRAIAAMAGVAFNLDVTLNRDHGITGVFAGELFGSHAAGCEFARRTAMVAVREPYDVVVTTNSGYPLDQNLYQSVKGMSAAAQIVRPGGTIVIATECADGLPDHGRYRHLLAEAAGPEDFLALLGQPGFQAHDQWQVQLQAQIQMRARVLVNTSGVTSQQLRSAWLEPVDDVGQEVSRLLEEAGPGGRLAVLPQGPQTIPYLAADTG